MFESLTNKLQDIFDRLGRRGVLSEADVDVALREVRLALLEADVALPVAKDFIKRVRERAIGTEVLKALKPAQNLVDLTDLAAQANVIDSFKPVVTAEDGTIRGIPFGPAMGGGI
ncbi:MAG: signal recognition particle receptor subunit alpha, partial [Aggregatilineales bacterium]